MHMFYLLLLIKEIWFHWHCSSLAVFWYDAWNLYVHLSIPMNVLLYCVSSYTFLLQYSPYGYSDIVLFKMAAQHTISLL